ncbi:MAG: flotillin-like FloA family protein [Bacteroidota bacterium]
MKKFIFISAIFALLFMVSCQNSEPVEYSEDAVEELTNLGLEENDTTFETDSFETGTLVFLIISVVILGPGLILFFYYFIPLGLWYETRLSGIKVSWMALIIMRWQRIPQALILKTLIRAENAGLSLDAKELSEQYLAEVDIEKVVNTLIRATNAKLTIPLEELAEHYLAQVDIEKVIHAQITAKNANLDIPIDVLASHYLAQVDVEEIVDALITAHNSGYEEMTLEDLKEHFLSNGDVKRTVDAFVAARKAELPNFEFSDIAAIDLAGINIEKAIEAAITPRVVETAGVTGIARDGVQLTMKLKVTLRAYIKSIIGGASEETVLARVNESLASEIGNSTGHHEVLTNPYELADRVEQRDLGKGTAFQIISIDVSDIQVGRDVNAELMRERAKAQAELAKAEVIRAEEKVQKAMASAFMDGNLSVNDYNNIRNTEADTKMRHSIGKSAKKQSESEHEEQEEQND